jgi:2-oxo-4-hydroxy-4-carboxy-5-ureidoimidazoline decarboxylase
MRTIDNINDLNKSDFLSIFGNVFEKTESVALEAFESKPFKNFEDIVLKMLNIYENYEKNKILEILNAHPELAVAKKMTSESISEQASAKLNQCSNDEYEEFERLNTDYKKKFGFPFIIAVKGKNKDEILNNFRQRIKNSSEIEFDEAKIQVKKIALIRLEEILEIN